MKKVSLKKIFNARIIFRSPGFFLLLSLILVFLLGVFTVKNLRFIVSRLKTSLDSNESSATAPRFDIEGFKALNLVKKKT